MIRLPIKRPPRAEGRVDTERVSNLGRVLHPLDEGFGIDLREGDGRQSEERREAEIDSSGAVEAWAEARARGTRARTMGTRRQACRTSWKLPSGIFRSSQSS